LDHTNSTPQIGMGRVKPTLNAYSWLWELLRPSQGMLLHLYAYNTLQ